MYLIPSIHGTADAGARALSYGSKHLKLMELGLYWADGLIS